VQKGVDVGIATLMLKLAAQNRYERLILAAGDGDFEDAISYIKSELHKEIWITGFDDSVSVDLQSYADHVVWLDNYINDIKKGR
jgi:nijmegen breakage syndrome protein 1